MRLVILILILLVGLSEIVSAQWRKIFDFGNPAKSIDFLEGAGPPAIGFVGTQDISNPNNNKLWRTTNGGFIWQEINLLPVVTTRKPCPRSFTFKNNLEGWFCDYLYYYSIQEPVIYKTSDGGLTWQYLLEYNAYSVKYIASTDRIIATGYPTYRTSIDGVNFSHVDIPTSSGTVGVCFSDDKHGIITPILGQSLFTQDGGLSWQASTMRFEQFQPVGIEGTQIFFAMCERDAFNIANRIFRSNDGGVSWSQIYQYPDQTEFKCTGTLQHGKDMTLFFQTVGEKTEGIMMSKDSGVTFNSICGPPQLEADTKFFVVDTFIYAADGYGCLWLNTSGIGSNSKPILSQSSVSLTSSVCSSKEKLVTFTLFDSCNGKHAQLLDANITGSSDFSIISGASSRIIKTDDSLVINYAPSDLTDDFAVIHLRFKLGWKIFDTTVALTGKPTFSREKLIANFTTDTVTAINCSNYAARIYFTVQDTCLNQYARLDTILVSGSKAFWGQSSIQYPRSTHADDVFHFTFTPRKYGADTAFVTLWFSFEGITFDTTVSLIGIYEPSLASLQLILSDTLLLASAGCDSSNDVLYFSLDDSCTGQSGNLVSVAIPSPDFKINSSSFPASDSLVVTYTGSGNERTPMLLHFSIGGYDYDTIVYLLGTGSGQRDSVAFIASLTNNNVPAEKAIEYLVTPSKAVSGKNLSEMAFDVILDEDLLEVRGVSAPSGLGLSDVKTAQPNGVVTHHITLTGTDIALDPASPIIKFDLFTYITDTKSTPIALSNLKLNGFDPDYERCTLSATSQDMTFTLALLCGDRTIVDFMRHGRIALDITSIRPNPTRDEVTVEIVAEGAVTIGIYDALGKLVQTFDAGRIPALRTLVLPVDKLSSGSYVMRVSSGGEVVSRGFVVER
jgi:photosystem II stability/assembly factor-like uncharacterized protein